MAESINLGELASATAVRKKVIVAAESHGKARRYELWLKEDGPAQRFIALKWSRTMMELAQESPAKFAVIAVVPRQP